MLAELNKEKDKTERADFSFVQNLKSQIRECKDKLDKLLDLQLSGTISTEEYTEKKQKILNRKIEISEKLRAFQQKGYSWLELAKRFISEANEAKNAASSTVPEKGVRNLFCVQKRFLTPFFRSSIKKVGGCLS